MHRFGAAKWSGNVREGSGATHAGCFTIALTAMLVEVGSPGGLGGFDA
jgi:hypothetical protein